MSKQETNKAPDAPRTRSVRVRVNDAEYAAFVSKAKENGFKTISDYLRTLIKNEKV